MENHSNVKMKNQPKTPKIKQKKKNQNGVEIQNKK